MSIDPHIQRVHALTRKYLDLHPDSTITLYLNPAIELARLGATDDEVTRALIVTEHNFRKFSEPKDTNV